jgi:hypothetical protein
MIAALGLQPGPQPFVLYDREGPAVALVTWRTQYETSEGQLPLPRLQGCAIVASLRVVDRLRALADADLSIRDFIIGSDEFASKDAAS